MFYIWHLKTFFQPITNSTMKTRIFKILTCAALGLYSTSCTEKATDSVEPAKMPTSSNAQDESQVIPSRIGESDDSALKASTSKESGITRLCTYASLGQNNNYSASSPNPEFDRFPKQYIAGQTVFFRLGVIPTTDCDLFTNVDILLTKGSIIYAVLQTNFGYIRNTQTYTLTLPSNLPTGQDYGIAFRYGDPRSYGSPNNVTIYGTDASTANLVQAPNGITSPPGSGPVTAQWDTSIFQPNESLDIYVYGDGEYNQGQRTKVGTVINSQGSFIFYPPSLYSNYTNNTFSGARYRVRIQKTSDGSQGGNSTDNFSYLEPQDVK